MATLYIPNIAKLIEGVSSPAEVYRRLKSHCYLSKNARSHPENVIALIEKTRDEFFKYGPKPGGGLAWETVDALFYAGFLSIWARTWGKIPRRH